MSEFMYLFRRPGPADRIAAEAAGADPALARLVQGAGKESWKRTDTSLKSAIRWR
jgi:hypothetical protein